MAKLKRGSNIEALKAPVKNQLANELFNQFNEFHGMGARTDKAIEIEFYENVLQYLKFPIGRFKVEDNTYIFMPSSAGECSRNLYFHLKGTPRDKTPTFPYHTRWTRNSSLVHEGIQKDLLYMEKLMPDAPFVILRDSEENVPLWEDNTKTMHVTEYKGKKIGLTGKMDGMLLYKPKDLRVGFEIKTKSNTNAQVGDYCLKDASEHHKIQQVSYSIMYGINDFLFLYEAVAKDSWAKGAEARSDLKTFYFFVTEAMRLELLEKFYQVILAVEANELPPKEPDKCIFCKYKTQCLKEDK